MPIGQDLDTARVVHSGVRFGAYATSDFAVYHESIRTRGEI